MKPIGTLRYTALTFLLSASTFLPANYAIDPPREIWSQQTSVDPGNGFEVVLDAAGNALHLWSSHTNSILAKFSSGGAPIWRREIPADLTPLQLDQAGNAVVAGRLKEIVGGSERTNFYTAKFAGTTGNVVWEQRYPENRQLHDWIDLKLEGDNVIVLSAQSVVPISDPDTTLTKYSGADGTQLWQQKVGPGAGIIAVGTNGTLAVWLGPTLKKLSSVTGSELWSATQSHLTNNFSCSEMIFGHNGDIAITGVDYPAAYVWGRMYTGKFSGTDGKLIWENWITPLNLSGVLDTYGQRVIELPDGDIVALGMRGSGTQGYANTPHIVRYASEDGKELWSKHYSFSESPNVPRDRFPYLTTMKRDGGDGNIIFGVATFFYTFSSSRSATFEVSAATGDKVWQLTHTNHFLPAFDYRGGKLVVGGQERSTSSALVKLFRDGPELSITPVNTTEFEIGWSTDYRGWKLQRLTTSLDSSAPAWTPVPGSEGTTTMRLSKEQNSGGIFQLVQ